MSDAFQTRITSESPDNEDDAALLAHALAGVEPIVLLRGFSTALLRLHVQLEEARDGLLAARVSSRSIANVRMVGISVYYWGPFEDGFFQFVFEGIAKLSHLALQLSQLALHLL